MESLGHGSDYTFVSEQVARILAIFDSKVRILLRKMFCLICVERMLFCLAFVSGSSTRRTKKERKKVEWSKGSLG